MRNGRLVQREDAWPATRKSGFNSPAGPLNDEYSSSMVKRKSFLASNEEVRVRLLVELLNYVVSVV